MSGNGRVARPGLREVTRNAVRREIAATAMALFAERGFENTTVDQIAAAVGMSARSVFRYFPSKEDMAVATMADLGQEVAAALAARPAAESAWAALRRALQVCVVSLEGSGPDRAAMLAATPALDVALLGKHRQWQDLLVPVMAERLRGPAGSRRLRAQALVGSALACLDAAAREWAGTGGASPLSDLADLAFSAGHS